MKKLIAIGALCVAFPLGAQAGSSSASVDVHASTLGAGIGLSIPVSEKLSGRLSLSKFSYASQTTSNASKSDEANTITTCNCSAWQLWLTGTYSMA